MRKLILLVALIVASVTTWNLLGSKPERKVSNIESLLERLKSPEARTRAVAAAILGARKEKGAVPSLVEALKDPDASVRSYAAEALGQIGDPSARDALRGALKDGVPTVRQKAQISLLPRPGEAVDSEQARDLVAALEAQDFMTRTDAMSIIAGLAPNIPEAIPGLIKALRDPNIDVRWLAADTLARFGSPVVPVLIAELNDSSSENYFHLAQAIGEIGPAASAAVPRLIALLNDNAERTRQAAAAALGKIRSKEAVGPLERLLTTEQSEIVREAALKSLAALN